MTTHPDHPTLGAFQALFVRDAVRHRQWRGLHVLFDVVPKIIVGLLMLVAGELGMVLMGWPPIYLLVPVAMLGIGVPWMTRRAIYTADQETISRVVVYRHGIAIYYPSERVDLRWDDLTLIEAWAQSNGAHIAYVKEADDRHHALRFVRNHEALAQTIKQHQGEPHVSDTA